MEILPFEDLPKPENIPQNILDKIKAFEDEHDMVVYHNIDFEELVISKDGQRVGSISPQRAPFDGFLDELHLNFEVDPSYRGRGIGKFLYSLYEDFHEIYPDIFPLPQKEYTQKVSMLGFYVKNNVYNIVEKYDQDNMSFRQLNLGEIDEILHIFDDDLDTMYRLSR